MPTRKFEAGSCVLSTGSSVPARSSLREDAQGGADARSARSELLGLQHDLLRCGALADYQQLTSAAVRSLRLPAHLSCAVSSPTTPWGEAPTVGFSDDRCGARGSGVACCRAYSVMELPPPEHAPSPTTRCDRDRQPTKTPGHPLEECSTPPNRRFHSSCGSARPSPRPQATPSTV